MTLVEAITCFAVILIFCDFVEPAIYQRRNREKVEALCIKESPLKTYFDNVITNVIITIPMVLVFAIFMVLVSVFGL